MDNITHSLTGLALARAGLNRTAPHATALLIISANAPDVDAVSMLKSQLTYLEIHRGYAHSLIGLPVMALLSVLIVAAIFRRSLPWMRAWLLCCLGVLSHLLLDWTNSYGIRLFLPFSSRWVHLDWNNLYDGYILAILLFAAVWPLFARLVSSEIGDRAPQGRGIAVFALGFFLLFDAARGVLHSRAVAELQARLYNGETPLKAAALPQAFNPLRWTAIVETPGSYRVSELNALEQFDPELAQKFYKPDDRPSYEAAKQLEPFRYFLYFSRFPLWSDVPVTIGPQPGVRVELTDLRFGIPGAGFHSVALENERGQVLRAWFTLR